MFGLGSAGVRLDQFVPLLGEVPLQVGQRLLDLVHLGGRTLGTGATQHERGQTWWVGWKKGTL